MCWFKAETCSHLYASWLKCSTGGCNVLMVKPFGLVRSSEISVSAVGSSDTRCSGERPFELPQWDEFAELRLVNRAIARLHFSWLLFIVCHFHRFFFFCLPEEKPLSGLWKIRVGRPDWWIDCAKNRQLPLTALSIKSAKQSAHLFLL